MNKISNEGTAEGGINYYTPSRMQLEICVKISRNVHMLCLRVPCLVNWLKRNNGKDRTSVKEILATSPSHPKSLEMVETLFLRLCLKMKESSVGHKAFDEFQKDGK